MTISNVKNTFTPVAPQSSPPSGSNRRASPGRFQYRGRHMARAINDARGQTAVHSVSKTYGSPYCIETSVDNVLHGLDLPPIASRFGGHQNVATHKEYSSFRFEHLNNRMDNNSSNLNELESKETFRTRSLDHDNLLSRFVQRQSGKQSKNNVVRPFGLSYDEISGILKRREKDIDALQNHLLKCTREIGDAPSRDALLRENFELQKRDKRARELLELLSIRMFKCSNRNG
eukprot:gene588-1007_t